MQLQLSINIPAPSTLIEHSDKILLIGSCFTEHMSTRLIQSKWQTLANPNGILFNPLSVADALNSYITRRTYTPEQLFYLNELWQHWDFHSRFSNTDRDIALNDMNESIADANRFLKTADWLIITLGSAYQYYDLHTGETAHPVANCHRAPGQWFEKRLLQTDTIIRSLQQTIDALKQFNPQLKITFTISPVRHIRDGVIENNRSKARLIEAVHTLCETQKDCFYFPAYELAIDVLRDYRFYDIDMVHPNYACTQYIWEQFTSACLSERAREAMVIMKDITTAFQHKTRFPDTKAHLKFLETYSRKVAQSLEQYPYADLTQETRYFSGQS